MSIEIKNESENSVKINGDEAKCFFRKDGSHTYEAQRLTERLNGLADCFTFSADSGWRKDYVMPALPELLHVIKECADDLLVLFANEWERTLE